MTDMTISADGTPIAFQTSGDGPAVILIEAAGHYRGLSSFEDVAPQLAQHLTVVEYDRRGRGESGDTAPYGVAREVEDLAALIDHVGGSAFVYGFSSGALLALHAAAAGLPIPRLAVLEPPLRDDGGSGTSEFTAQLAALADSGSPADLVTYFNEGIGVPPEVLDQMRGTAAWAAMESVAATLVYDGVVGDESTPALLAGVTQPTLVLDSLGSSDDLTGMAATVARGLLDGLHVSLPGAWHGPEPAALTHALLDFFRP